MGILITNRPTELVIYDEAAKDIRYVPKTGTTVSAVNGNVVLVNGSTTYVNTTPNNISSPSDNGLFNVVDAIHTYIGSNPSTLLDELHIVPVSFEAGEQCDNRIKFPFACTVIEICGVVTKAIAATDDATIIAKNNAGATMATGTLTFTASDPLETTETVLPSTNNTFAAGETMRLTGAKSTAGGKALVSVKITRS